MRKNIFLFAAVASLVLVSCGTNVENAEETTVEKTTLTLNKDASKLEWKGGKSEEDFHVGTISFSKGMIELENGELISGSFEVDMNSIKVTDEGMNDGKREYLAGHLMNPDFFDTEKFPTVKVSVGTYKNGILPTTFELMGKKITKDVPVSFKKTEKGATISGQFDVDFAELATPGFQKDPESGEQISTKFSYDMNLELSM